MREQHNEPANGSDSHLEAAGAASRTQNCRPTRSSTDAPDPAPSVVRPFQTDLQVATQTLLETQTFLASVSPAVMSSSCRRLLLRAELRVCFLILHFGSSQLLSQDWIRIRSRMQYLEKSLNHCPDR